MEMKAEIRICREFAEEMLLKADGLDIKRNLLHKYLALEIYSRWFMESKMQVFESWFAYFKDIEEKYGHKDSLILADYAASFAEKDKDILLIIECERLEERMLPGIREFAAETCEYLGRAQWSGRIERFLPSSQEQIRKQRNNTEKPIELKCLHEEFYIHAQNSPKAIALIWYEENQRKVMNYGELREKSLKVAAELAGQGVKEGDLVGISLGKGVEQILAVYGVLALGGAYVPIGIQQPFERKTKIMETGSISYILTDDKGFREFEKEEQINPIHVSACLNNEASVKEPFLTGTDKTAYVIFTSGTTGTPKGVVISHRAAYNTIYDVREKFSVTKNSRGITISELDFDLSVFDILGILSAGGAVVVVDEENKKEAAFWKRAIIENEVTVWNSVPALFEMLMTACESDSTELPLKSVLLSGDWIKLDLLDKLRAHTKECRFISLGGATEAAIWSNYYEVERIKNDWCSIPYGMPLGNQKWRIVNASELDCPDYVSGELWIGGAGVADCYLNDYELTGDKFVKYEGERWYRTGDLARYDSEGIVEFLGRMDSQVKLNGYRIELGEIENTTKKFPQIADGIAGIVEEEQKKYLGMVVVPDINTKITTNIDCSADDYGYDDSCLKERMIIIGNYLGHLCSTYEQALKERKGNFEILGFWKNWLEKNTQTEQNADFKILLENVSPKGTKLIEILARYTGLIEQVLRGKERASKLIEYKELSPEFWSLEGEDTQFFMEKILAEKTFKKPKVRVAILGGRSGEIILKYLSDLREEPEVTLFERSYGMLDAAREKLQESELEISYCVIEDGVLTQEQLFAFDAVIAVNDLHTYWNPSEGIRLASMLLQNGGKLFAIEYEEMDPVGVLISGILENGFKRKRFGGRERTTLLTKEEWIREFAVSSFGDVRIIQRGNLGAMLFQAEASSGHCKWKEETFKEYLRDELPSYMIPEKIILASQVRFSKNGKVDRKETLRLLRKSGKASQIEMELQGTEKEIAEIWKEILQCKIISSNQSFFELGGDSLSATRFLARIKKDYNIEIPLKKVFEAPSLSSVAALVQGETGFSENLLEGEI